VIILGCGYIGHRLAEDYRARGIQPCCVVRSQPSAQTLEQAGFSVLRLDLDQPDFADLPTAGSDLFYLAPPPAEGLHDPRLRALLARLEGSARPRRLVYVSTTGVYGDCRGRWVDESSPVSPQTPRARRRLDAERALAQWAKHNGGEYVILRVPGIYGPGRLPLERIRKRLPLLRPEEAPYTNRIHADDLVQACVAAMQRGRLGEVYNVCDGHPSTMAEYFLQVADLAGLPRPPLVGLAEAQQVLSAGMLSYQRESRRIGSRKLVEELGVVLRYPSLETGLPACIESG
jgi:nucleoside-diphosphate-sugar epimerase